MTTTVYSDPATGDVYVLVGEIWHGFLGPYGHAAIVAEEVVPDRLEVMTALVPVNRGARRREAVDA
jgi:hypothetical protein